VKYFLIWPSRHGPDHQHCLKSETEIFNIDTSGFQKLFYYRFGGFLNFYQQQELSLKTLVAFMKIGIISKRFHRSSLKQIVSPRKSTELVLQTLKKIQIRLRLYL
jgi:hypothetical protein